MRTAYGVFLMLAILLAGTYWYKAVEADCRLPIYYTIGEIDSRFGISEDEVRTALSSAESVWEEATGRNLFTYDDNASLRINFIYDERQKEADEAEIAKGQLDGKADVNAALGETYAKLVAEYDKLRLAYERELDAYERELNAYNNEVKKYNDAGGAPPDVYESLEREKQELDAKRKEINNTADKLNGLSRQINEIGERGNTLIDQYNESVRRFNDTYGASEEFTQGDYQGREINIYTFKDRRELTLVLAHEFGHAMSLDHVDNPASIMYYLMGGQQSPLAPTPEDLQEFDAVCGDISTYDKLRELILNWLKTHNVI